MYSDKEIRQNLELFYTPVEMPGGYMFDHVQTLRRVDLYYNSQFENGPTDDQGFDKFFFNLVKPACDIGEKFVDLDSKDFVLYSDNDSDEELRLFIMRQDFRQWMKNSDFGSALNEMGANFPKYGHIVTKSVEEGVINTPVHNLRMDTAAPNLKKSPFVYELLDLTRRDLRGMKGWYQDQVDILFARGDKRQTYGAYECYHQNENPYGKEWARTIRADLLHLKNGNGMNKSIEAMTKRGQDEFVPSVILYEDEVKKLPYDETKWLNVPGRWLGMGFVEDLFDEQMARNEVTNIERRKLHLSSLVLLQSTSDVPQSNLLTDVDNGQILRVRDPLTVLSFEERNLPAFREAKQDIDSHVEKRTFSFDIATGGNLPAGTPLGVSRIQAGMVLNYFDKKRENMALLLKRVILNDILPSFKKESALKHAVRFLGSEAGIERLYSEVAKSLVRERILDNLFKRGTVPAPGEAQKVENQALEDIKKNRKLLVRIIEGYYEDANEYVDVMSTGEQRDFAALGQTLFNALTAVASNPNIILDDRLRPIFFKMLEIAGVSSDELGLLEQKVQNAPAPPQAQPQMQPPQQNGAAPRPGQQPAGRGPAMPTAPGSPMMSAMLASVGQKQ